MPFNGPFRHPQAYRSFVVGQSAEKLEHDETCFVGVLLFQRLQRFIEEHNSFAWTRRGKFEAIYIKVRLAATPLDAAATSDLIDNDPPHGFRSRCEKVRSAGPNTRSRVRQM